MLFTAQQTSDHVHDHLRTAFHVVDSIHVPLVTFTTPFNFQSASRYTLSNRILATTMATRSSHNKNNSGTAFSILGYEIMVLVLRLILFCVFVTGKPSSALCKRPKSLPTILPLTIPLHPLRTIYSYAHGYAQQISTLNQLILQEWHCTIRGSPQTEFEGGLYHFRIILPAEYPFRPPSIMMLTPSGRFELNTKVRMEVTQDRPYS